jgi:hypothetical protein
MMDFVDGPKMSCMTLAPKMTIRKKDSGENGADTTVSTLLFKLYAFFLYFLHIFHPIIYLNRPNLKFISEKVCKQSKIR